MNHETCRERLLDLAYGELARREAAEVERHLAECAPCGLERDRLISTLGVMRRLEAPPPPDRGDAVVLAAARKAADDRRRDSFGLALRGFGIRIAAGTAFAVLAVFLLVNVRQVLRPPTEDVSREWAAPPKGEAPMAGPPTAAEPPSFAPAPPAAQPEDRARAEAPRRERGPAALAKKKAAAPGEPSASREQARAEPQAAAPAAPSPSAGSDERSGAMAPVPPSGKLSRRFAAPDVEEERRAAAREPERPAPGSPRADLLAAPSAAPAPERPGSASSTASGAADQRRPQAAAPTVGGAGGALSASRAREDAQPQQSRASSWPASAWAREIERRHAAGELSEAQKRFEPCPGGDVRRTAWIDAEQHILKLVRERADGFLVEEWFDEAGRLREAVVRGRAAGGAWSRRVTVGERGGEASQDVSDSGLAPEAPPPPLVKRDPSGAFFSGPGCSR